MGHMPHDGIHSARTSSARPDLRGVALAGRPRPMLQHARAWPGDRHGGRVVHAAGSVRQRALLSRMTAMTTSGAGEGQPASELITQRIAELDDWRGDTLGRMRKLIKEADPDVVEEWKWKGTPVWEHDGIICTGESYKKVVKLTFAKGASLEDPAGLFNSSLDGNVRRAIDIPEGEEVDASAFKALVLAAVALNKAKPAKKAKS